MPPSKRTMAERAHMWSVDPVTGCWNWLGSVNRAGYAHGYVHRKHYAEVNGPIPAAHHVHHRCDNPPCVNPAHLEAIPATAHFMHHKLHEKTGLTLDDIAEIRRLGSDRNVKAGDLAGRFGVNEATIYGYWSVHSWHEHLDGPIELKPGTCPMCGGEVHGKRTRIYCADECKLKATIIRQRERRQGKKAA